MPIKGPLPRSGDGLAPRKAARFAPNGDGLNTRVSMPVSVGPGAGVVLASAAGAVLADVATLLLMPPPPLEQAVDKAQHSVASTTILEGYDLRIQPPNPNGVRWPRC